MSLSPFVMHFVGLGRGFTLLLVDSLGGNSRLFATSIDHFCQAIDHFCPVATCTHATVLGITFSRKIKFEIHLLCCKLDSIRFDLAWDLYYLVKFYVVYSWSQKYVQMFLKIVMHSLVKCNVSWGFMIGMFEHDNEIVLG